jgi:hypothetical protein
LAQPTALALGSAFFGFAAFTLAGFAFAAGFALGAAFLAAFLGADFFDAFAMTQFLPDLG